MAAGERRGDECVDADQLRRPQPGNQYSLVYQNVLSKVFRKPF